MVQQIQCSIEEARQGLCKTQQLLMDVKKKSKESFSPSQFKHDDVESVLKDLPLLNAY